MSSVLRNSKWLQVLMLIGVNILYACVGVFTKYASQHVFLSGEYFVGLVGAILVLGLYAICWQQILKRIDLSTAYMFKGTSLIFVMLLAFAIFGEAITTMNIIGACVIVLGIAMYSIDDR